MVYQVAPSSKALGKRPIKHTPSVGKDGRNTHLTPPLTPNGDTHAPLVNMSVETRQKRTLPSRTRRGGPGVGSCEIDMNIIDTLKRTGETDQLIPSTSVFILTTDVNLVPSSSSDLGLTNYVNERYFDKPEVIKSYREQQEIQTPEYTQLQDDALVGGRLRARGEVDVSELSDAAYEKRHRKYEAFERRQRLREKEKLQYEHYKLKERIEQLRILDYTAFLSLPADTFGDTPAEIQYEVIDGDASSSPTPIQEGERRRKLMLDVALSLEERYRILLPNDRKGLEKKGERTSLSVSEPRTREQSTSDVDFSWKEPVQEVPITRKTASESSYQRRSTSAARPTRIPSPSPAPTALPMPIATTEPIDMPTQPEILAPSTAAVQPRQVERASSVKENGVRLKITLRPTARASSSDGVVQQSKASSKKPPGGETTITEPESRSNSFVADSDPRNVPAPQPTIEPYSRKEQTKSVAPVVSVSRRPPSFLGSLDSSSNHHYQVIRFPPAIVDNSISSAPLRKRPRLVVQDEVQEAQIISFTTEQTPATVQDASKLPEQTPILATPSRSRSPSRSVSPISSKQENLSASSGRRQQMPVILVAASHNEGREARKTSRAVLAFGVKVPQFPPAEFQLPQWLQDETDEHTKEETIDPEQQASISLIMLHSGDQPIPPADRTSILPRAIP